MGSPRRKSGDNFDYFGNLPLDIQKHVYNYQSDEFEQTVKLYPLDMILHSPLFTVVDAMKYAARYNRMDVINYLIQKQMADRISLNMALIYATEARNIDLMDYLLRSGADVDGVIIDEKDDFGLSDMDMFHRMMARDRQRATSTSGSRFEQNGPLYVAIETGNMDAIVFLLSHDVDLNLVGDAVSPLEFAIEIGQWDIARFMRANGAQTGPEELNAVIRTGDLGMIQIFMDGLVDHLRAVPAYVGEQVFTDILHQVILKPDVDVVNYIINFGFVKPKALKRMIKLAKYPEVAELLRVKSASVLMIVG